MKKSQLVVAIVLLVLLADQALKIWVKTTMSYGEEIRILGLPWALLHFVENEGMAFGIKLGGEYGKLALSIFRIIAVGFLAYYLRYLLQVKASTGLLVSFALILAGALGNILDSAFYGVIFSDSYHGTLATLFPPEGGYAAFLHGRVVDMFYFPVLSGYFPEWLPIWGGEAFLFFKPVFNIADVAITTGVLNILLFQRSFFAGHHHPAAPDEEGEPALDADVLSPEVAEAAEPAAGTTADTPSTEEMPATEAEDDDRK